MYFRLLRSVLPLIGATICLMSGVAATAPSSDSQITPFLEQGFYFDWNASEAVPIPTAAQCDTLHITWNRGVAVGPSPTAPYLLQVYTSTFIVPLIIDAGSGLSFDWPVPFVPDTQFQICMFDSKGVSGGCQRITTVYQRPNYTLDDPPICTNLSYPQGTLGVDAVVSNGALSQYGWVDQCTDISVTPTEGTPPFTLTIAPTLHPPYNITSNTMAAINWTVSLSWGMPFFISLVDSTGLGWAYGPLHSGGGGPTDCLALGSTELKGTTLSPAVAIGSGIGGLAVGVIVGLLGALLLSRWRKRRNARLGIVTRRIPSKTSLIDSSYPDYRDVPTTTSSDNSRTIGNQYTVEPFVLPDEFGGRLATRTSATLAHSRDGSNDPLTANMHSSTASTSQAASSSSRAEPSASLPPTLPQIVSSPLDLSSPQPQPTSAERNTPQVYVVHHDGGRAPVTVYTSDGTEVVELPPRYVDSGDVPRTGGSSQPLSPSDLQNNRQPGSRPRKGPRRIRDNKP